MLSLRSFVANIRNADPAFGVAQDDSVAQIAGEDRTGLAGSKGSAVRFSVGWLIAPQCLGQLANGLVLQLQPVLQ